METLRGDDPVVPADIPERDVQRLPATLRDRRAAHRRRVTLPSRRPIRRLASQPLSDNST